MAFQSHMPKHYQQLPICDVAFISEQKFYIRVEYIRKL